jgi:NADP-dependent 3-hydroxy acid dehydrogenase YdfG
MEAVTVVNLDGAVCLVTGASSGIGRALAPRLSVAGAKVVVLGRDGPALQGVAARSGGVSTSS